MGTYTIPTNFRKNRDANCFGPTFVSIPASYGMALVSAQLHAYI
jgi:hypothetical protein